MISKICGPFGKITGMAFTVPNRNISVIDLAVRTKKPVTFGDIKKKIKKASEENYKGIVNYTEDEVVLKNFVSSLYSCIFDDNAGIALNDNFFKLVAWYDNEYGYSSRWVDLEVYVAKI